MKKLISLLLTFSMALSACAGIAEETYTPGQITRELTAGALAQGRHLSLSLSGIFEPSSGLINDAEGQAQLEAVGRVLEYSALRLGYASTEEGPRFEFGGYVYDDDGSLVSTDNSVTLTHDGIVFITDLLEDRKITVSWETIMNAADLDEDTQSTLLALRDADWAGISEQAAAFFRDFGELAASLAAPYLNVIADWAAALPTETVDEAINALVPETPGMTRVRVSESHLLILADRLAEVLSQDSILLPAADTLLQAVGIEDIDAATLISQIRTQLVSAELDDMSLFFTYTTENTLPFVFNADLVLGDIATPAADLLVMVQPDENGADKVTLRASVLQDSSSVSLSADGTVTLDPNNKLIYSYAFAVDTSMNGATVMSATASSKNEAFTAESGQPGYRMEETRVVNLPGYIATDEETYDVSTTSSSEQSTEWVRTEEGGESCTVHQTMEATESGDVATDMISDAYYAIEPAENGLFDAYFSEIFSMPDAGIESLGFSLTLYGDLYESSQSELTSVALEDLTGEEMDMLISEFGSAARTKRDQFINILPLELQDAATSILCGITSDPETEIPTEDEIIEAEPEETDLSYSSYVSGYTGGYNAGYDSGFSAGFQAALSLYGIGTEDAADGAAEETYTEGFEDLIMSNEIDAFGGTVVEQPEETDPENAID